MTSAAAKIGYIYVDAPVTVPRKETSQPTDELALEIYRSTHSSTMGDLVGCGLEETFPVSSLLAFLITLQAAALNTSSTSNSSFNVSSFDPKTYVDLPLRQSLQSTESAFLALPKTPSTGVIANATLQKFLTDFFDPPGAELLAFRPSDFSPHPPEFLPNVRNPEVLHWAFQVHEIWRNLSREEKPEVATHPDQFTMVPLKHPFVVPGSRFREVYYWDSYWVIRGLVVSKMTKTAKGIVENLLAMVESFGFVPNGARKYYLNRSQPPLLSEMVRVVFKATGDETLLQRALPILISEHSFWTSAPHSVSIGKYNLSRYYARWNTPRPESFTIDENLAMEVEETQRAKLYRDIATAAETGWDFSSRWMGDRNNLTTLRTSRIVPADLNAFLFQMEKNIARFADSVGDVHIAREFSALGNERRIAIDAVLWNEATQQWNDYWLPENFCPTDGPAKFDPDSRNSLAYASNFLPLWCGLLQQSGEEARVENLVQALKKSGLLFPAGIATSLRQTGQQWDLPNGWAPLQHMIIEGLHSTGSESAWEIAEDLARRWLRTNFATFQATGAMQEKYDVRVCGVSGGGGEYSAQTGFGWSNGVVLALLDHYGWAEHHNISCA